MASISSAAAFDDVYQLVELSFKNRDDSEKLAQIAQALEESIPKLDPVRFRGELEHVLAGPDIPQLAAAKAMAKAALEGKQVTPPVRSETGRRKPPRGLLAWTSRLFGRQPGRPRD
jgi:hypothetical protein